jgi:hypothetical protein
LQVSSFNDELQVYECENCGIQQSQELFASVRLKSEERGGRLRTSLPSGVRASLILERRQPDDRSVVR